MKIVLIPAFLKQGKSIMIVVNFAYFATIEGCVVQVSYACYSSAGL